MQVALLPQIGRAFSIGDKKKKIELVFQKTNGKCWYCGCDLFSEYIFDENDKCVMTIRRWHVDHVYPYSKGGSDEIENLVPSCISCNLKKKDKVL